MQHPAFHGSVASPLFCRFLIGFRSSEPFRFYELADVVMSEHRQIPLLQFLLYDLPATHRTGLVHGRHPLGVDLHIGQLGQLAVVLDRFVDGARRRRLDEQREQLACAVDLQQLGVGDGAARELVDALRDLRRCVSRPCSRLNLVDRSREGWGNAVPQT